MQHVVDPGVRTLRIDRKRLLQQRYEGCDDAQREDPGLHALEALARRCCQLVVCGEARPGELEDVVDLKLPREPAGELVRVGLVVESNVPGADDLFQRIVGVHVCGLLPSAPSLRQHACDLLPKDLWKLSWLRLAERTPSCREFVREPAGSHDEEDAPAV